MSATNGEVNKVIFRVVLLGAAALCSGALLLVYSVSSLSQNVLPTSAVADPNAANWSMLVVIGCASVSLTCLVAITQTLVKFANSSLNKPKEQ